MLENRVTIVKYTNPHRFWIRESRNAETLANLENELHQDLVKLVKSRSAQAEIGDLVAVQDLGNFRRATVKEAKTSGYRCYLLDHPKTVVVDHLYKLPEKYVKIPPLINIASLSNVVAVQRVLNVETSDIDITASEHFTSSCIRLVKDMLKKSTDTFFFIEYPVNHVLCGCILLNIDEKVINLSQYLLERKFVTENKKLFLESLRRSYGNMSAELSLEHNTLSEDDIVQSFEGVGRGCIRKSLRAERQIAASCDKHDFVKKWIGALDSNVSTLDDDLEPILEGNSSAQSISDISDISDHITKEHLKILQNKTPAPEVPKTTPLPKKHRVTPSEIAEILVGKNKTNQKGLSHEKLDCNDLTRFRDTASKVSSSGSSSQQHFTALKTDMILQKQTDFEPEIKSDNSQNLTKRRLTPTEVRELLKESKVKTDFDIHKVKKSDKPQMCATSRLTPSEIRKLLLEKDGNKEKEVINDNINSEKSCDEMSKRINYQNLSPNNLKTAQSTENEDSKEIPKLPDINQVIKNSFSLKEINKMSTQNRLIRSTEEEFCNTGDFKPIGLVQRKSFKLQTSENLNKITTLRSGKDSTTDTSSFDKESQLMEYQTSSDVGYEPHERRKTIKLKKNPSKQTHDLTTSDQSSSDKESKLDEPDTTTSEEPKEEAPSDDEEFKGVVLKNNLHSFCKCASCLKWLDKDENEAVFLGDSNKPDLEVWRGTPQPLIKKEAEDSAVQLIVRKGGGRENATKVEKDMAPSILLHGPGHIPTPVSDIQQLPFSGPVHRALRECGIKNVLEMQMYVWPALMRSMNACVVNSSGTGKTLCYLPALSSFIMQKQERYPFLPKEPGPIAVILCDGINNAEGTYSILTRFLHSTRKRVNTYLLVPPIKSSEFKHLKSADILVTTPKILVRILSSRQINLKRLCHLVVEDIELILERTATEFYRFMRAIQTMLNHRVFVNSVQIVTTSKRWTKPLETFVSKLATLPIICIGSHLESVMYGKANIKMHFLKCEKKKTDIADLLKEDPQALKTLIVCNTDDEVTELAEYLQIQGISAIGLTESMLREEIEEQEIMWMMTPDKKNCALICTDTLLHAQLSVTTARMLIHYSLPDTSWTAFARRFKSVLDVHDSPFDAKFSKANSCRVHIFVDESCNKQFPRLYYFLKQLGTTLPEKFTQFCKQLEQSEEQVKIEALHRICKRLKLLGRCDKFRCKKRHVFSSELDVSPDIPKSGQIKFKLLHAQDVTHYGIRLLEHTDTEWNVHPVANYDAFVTTDLKIAVEANKLSAMNVAVGKQYAYFDTECVVYRRCKILRVLSVHNITNSAHEVKVRFIDDGIVKNIFASLLYELPNQYMEFPPQSIDARLVNVVPLEGDTKWNRRTKSKLDHLLEDYQRRYPDSYCTGTIVLQVGGTVYLGDIKIQQYLPGVDETVTLLNLKKKLTEMDVADVDETVLPNLQKVWISSGLELPNYVMKLVPKKIIKIPQLKPTWAFMDCCTDIYNQVYFSYGVSPDKFYVRLAKMDKFFVSLQDDVQEAVLKPFYPEIKQLNVGHCYLARNPGDDGYGRVIAQSIEDDIVDCFFVDYGDSAKIHKDELKFLSDELIQKLPFQAIECALYGITSILDDWPADAIDVLYNYTFVPDTDIYRDLHANVIRTETSTFRNTKYFVALVDNLTGSVTVLNDIIVDCGFAIDKSDERLEDVVLPEVVIPIDNQEGEEQEEPSIIPCMEIDKLDTDDLALLNDINPDVETSLIENNGFDCYIQDLIMFRNLILKKNFDTTAKNEVTCSKDKAATSREVPYTPMKALPPVNYKTPNVLWHQDNQVVKLEISVANVKEYTLHVLRLRNLVFHATINNEDYKLNFNLYNSVCSSIQHTATGVTVRVTMTKKKEEEWPRLTSSKEKLRNIKYDLTKLQVEEDKKKKRRFLELDDGLEDEETDDEYGPTYLVQGSDSDDSDDSQCYDDIAQ